MDTRSFEIALRKGLHWWAILSSAQSTRIDASENLVSSPPRQYPCWQHFHLERTISPSRAKRKARRTISFLYLLSTILQFIVMAGDHTFTCAFITASLERGALGTTTIKKEEDLLHIDALFQWEFPLKRRGEYQLEIDGKRPSSGSGLFTKVPVWLLLGGSFMFVLLRPICGRSRCGQRSSTFLWYSAQG